MNKIYYTINKKKKITMKEFNKVVKILKNNRFGDYVLGCQH
jgi:hypothetical protein